MAFTKYRTFRLETGLYLIEPKGGKTYQARCRVDGEWRYTGTDTADIREAEQFAVRWFRQLHAGRDGHETVAQAADAYLASIRDPGKQAYHTATFNATREYWSPGMGRPAVPVTEIDTPKLLEFVKWRQVQSPRGRSGNIHITSNTLHKDLVTLRQVLKYAVARGAITRVPEFPGQHIIGRIERNPQPWLDKVEWVKLVAVAEQRIKDAPNIRTRAQRTELLAFIRFMHSTCMRVDEARGVRARDVTVKYTPAATPDELERLSRRAAKKHRPGTIVALHVQLRYLEINLRQSKTGPRNTISRTAIHPSVSTLLESRQPEDLLFSESHRDAFRELLIAASLPRRLTARGTASVSARPGYRIG